jgi:integrase/recombinase XerC
MTDIALSRDRDHDALMDNLIEVYAERLRAATRSPYTISTRTRILRHADRMLPRGLDKANGDDLAAYLARPLKAWSRSTHFSALRGYYSTMVAAGRLSHDPTTTIARPSAGQRTPNPVSDAELTAAIERSPNPWRAATIIAAYAGLRCIELADLDRSDVTAHYVRVRHGKGDKARYVPTHPVVWDLVGGMPAGPILCRASGRPITPEWLTSTQHAHWSRVGLPDVHWHRFRHWFGTTLSEQGVPIEVIQALMGHASIETTRGYVRVSVSRHYAAMATLPTFVGGGRARAEV